MGNCIRHESPMTWAGEDWGSPVPEKLYSKNKRHGRWHDYDIGLQPTSEVEEERLLGEKSGVPSSTEVKIKITRQQLEDLLGRVDVQGLSVQQVLDQLMNVSDGIQTQHRSWRPALQSIPE